MLDQGTFYILMLEKKLLKKYDNLQISPSSMRDKTRRKIFDKNAQEREKEKEENGYSPISSRVLTY